MDTVRYASQAAVAPTLADPPGEATHWTAAAMAKASGISLSSPFDAGT